MGKVCRFEQFCNGIYRKNLQNLAFKSGIYGRLGVAELLSKISIFKSHKLGNFQILILQLYIQSEINIIKDISKEKKNEWRILLKNNIETQFKLKNTIYEFEI